MRTKGILMDGLDGIEITIEASASKGVKEGQVRLVGNADMAVKEGVVRAQSAVAPFIRPGIWHLDGGILVNLSPADLRKTGRSLDLPMAMVLVGLVLGLRQRDDDAFVLLGELGLDGCVRSVSGVLAAVQTARALKKRAVILPQANLAEARLIDGLDLYPVAHVLDALEVMEDRRAPDDGPRGMEARGKGTAPPDLRDVRGQFQARRALEISASGRHNLLMEGPPGSGKSMLARRFPGILPPLDNEEIMESARIRSLVRLVDPLTMHLPPFRVPHHSATPAGLAGGGSPLRPGEFSLAHKGVLFLDEFPEFDRKALEVLREPMEERLVHLTRATGVKTFPADFLLVAAMNPCPCGWHGLGDGRCTCTPRRVHNYRGRLSGPLLDRFDLRVVLKPVRAEELFSESQCESSELVAERVQKARTRQIRRYGPSLSNATVPDRVIRKAAGYGREERRFLLHSMKKNKLSARSLRRMERVARTIADLAGDKSVTCVHLIEALGLRLELPGGEE